MVVHAFTYEFLTPSFTNVVFFFFRAAGSRETARIVTLVLHADRIAIVHTHIYERRAWRRKTRNDVVGSCCTPVATAFYFTCHWNTTFHRNELHHESATSSRPSRCTSVSFVQCARSACFFLCAVDPEGRKRSLADAVHSFDDHHSFVPD